LISRHFKALLPGDFACRGLSEEELAMQKTVFVAKEDAAAQI
jgi:hypothetical protein